MTYYDFVCNCEEEWDMEDYYQKYYNVVRNPRIFCSYFKRNYNLNIEKAVEDKDWWLSKLEEYFKHLIGEKVW